MNLESAPRKSGVRIGKACWSLEMPPTPKLVLVCLSQYADHNGVCWPSISRISKETGLSDRAVQKWLDWLMRAKAISREFREGRSTRYSITPKAFDPRTACTPHPRTACTPTPEPDAGSPPNVVHLTPERGAPRSTKEVPVEHSADAGADAPGTAKDFLFGQVLKMLVEQGEKRSSARSLLGKLASVLGDEAAAAEARKAMAEQPGCLRSRLAGLLKGRGRRTAGDVGLWQQDYSEGLPVREAHA